MTIYVAGPPPTYPTTFEVIDGGTATFTAGQNILFYAGTKVDPGGSMHGHILPNGPWPQCGAKAASIVTVPQGQPQLPKATEKTNFILYPNPTNGNFTLVQKGDKTYGDVRIEVYSMRGEKVLTTEMIGEKQHEFSLSQVPVGLYFVKVVADDYAETIKLVITR